LNLSVPQFTYLKRYNINIHPMVCHEHHNEVIQGRY
jgi:hypothetical protein